MPQFNNNLWKVTAATNEALQFLLLFWEVSPGSNDISHNLPPTPEPFKWPLARRQMKSNEGLCKGRETLDLGREREGPLAAPCVRPTPTISEQKYKRLPSVSAPSSAHNKPSNGIPRRGEQLLYACFFFLFLFDPSERGWSLGVPVVWEVLQGSPALSGAWEAAKRFPSAVLTPFKERRDEPPGRSLHITPLVIWEMDLTRCDLIRKHTCPLTYCTTQPRHIVRNTHVTGQTREIYFRTLALISFHFEAKLLFRKKQQQDFVLWVTARILGLCIHVRHPTARQHKWIKSYSNFTNADVVKEVVEFWYGQPNRSAYFS